MPTNQAIDPAAIRDFLQERGYKLQMHSVNNVDIWRKEGGKIVWERTVESYNEALKAGLNHWLSEQLGIHWERLWAARSMFQAKFLDFALDNEHFEAIEKAIAWHEALNEEDES